MKIVIRADLNKTVAMGHVMRCLSVADALKEKGHRVVFVNASEDPVQLIESRGFESVVLNSDFSDTMGEIADFKRILNDIEPDGIIFDGYYFSVPYFNEFAGKYPLIYIDDYGKNAYPVDLLVNYNIYGDETDYATLYEGAQVKCPKLLLGTKYAPLRKAFRDVTVNSVTDRKPVEILVSTGGADLCGVARALITEYLNSPIENTRLNILAGPFSKDRDFILKAVSEHPDIISEYENITDMPAFLSKFDLALSAAGSTSYELCRMGIPTCLFCSADNQSMINETFKKKGICESAGNAEKNKSETIKNLLVFAEEYSASVNKRREMSEIMKKTVDAKGAKRIADEIVNSFA